MAMPCAAWYHAIRGGPIRIRGVVVVGVAARVDIPRIVGIAAIGTPQPDGLGIQPTPLMQTALQPGGPQAFGIGIMPCSDFIAHRHHLLLPVNLAAG